VTLATKSPRVLSMPHEAELPSTEQIRRVLRECQGNRTQAARILGLARSSFYRLLEERGLMRARPAAGLDGDIERGLNWRPAASGGRSRRDRERGLRLR
jgi:hypothetical protein